MACSHVGEQNKRSRTVRTLMWAPGIATRNKKLLGAPDIPTRNKNSATLLLSITPAAELLQDVPTLSGTYHYQNTALLNSFIR